MYHSAPHRRSYFQRDWKHAALKLVTRGKLHSMTGTITNRRELSVEDRIVPLNSAPLNLYVLSRQAEHFHTPAQANIPPDRPVDSPSCGCHTAESECRALESALFDLAPGRGGIFASRLPAQASSPTLPSAYRGSTAMPRQKVSIPMPSICAPRSAQSGQVGMFRVQGMSLVYSAWRKCRSRPSFPQELCSLQPQNREPQFA